MPWGRLDDSLYDHPKLDELPGTEDALDSIPGDGLVRLAAVGLWARAISWCNRFLTDGMVPRDRIAKLDGSRELADLLVRVGLFEPTSTGYLVHDFLEFNDSRDNVLERRRKEAERKAEWRKKKELATKPKRGSGTRPAGTDSGTPSVDGDVVPPVVLPESQRLSQRPSRRLSRDSTRARAGANPDPSRPDLLNEEDTPQPPASGGRRTTRRERSGPMRSSTTYQVITDDTPIDEIPEQFRDLFAQPAPAEVPS